jgi:CheY-like chemotaxis protein
MRAHANQRFQSGALVQSRPAPRLLVVEDEVLVRMMLAEELRDAGFPALEAAHADEAIDMLRHVPDIKLMISDIRMPGSMDGIALARLARSEHPDIKIIFACGSHCSINSVRHEGLFLKPMMFTALFNTSRNSWTALLSSDRARSLEQRERLPRNRPGR